MAPGSEEQPAWRRAGNSFGAGMTLPPPRPLRLHDPLVLPVHQLDAGLLDHEVEQSLFQQLRVALQFFPSDPMDVYKPEMSAVIRAMIHVLSVGSSAPSYGAYLQNLRLVDARRSMHENTQLAPGTQNLSRVQRHAWGLAQVVLPWLVQRGTRFLTLAGWADAPLGSVRQRVYRAVRVLEVAARASGLANLVVFLGSGVYASLVHRLLRVRLAYSNTHISRAVSFEFMNRQLVWHGFTEFLLFLLPFFNLDRIRRAISSRLRVGARPAANASAALPASCCAVCRASPQVQAHAIDCGHVYCYYCVKARVLHDPAWRCVRCDAPVVHITRAEFRAEAPRQSGDNAVS